LDADFPRTGPAPVKTLFLDPPHDTLDLARRTLAGNPHVARQAFEISLDEEDVLVLEGSVRSWFQKQIAQESLRGVAGVSRVRNRLRVVPR
jgi:osmotically-inducible protein OsmY